MNIHKLNNFFNPQRIALIGVTTNPNSVGGKVLGNLVGGGFRGVVYPVNPAAEAVLGIQCYGDLCDLPKTPDLGVICAPAPEVPAIVRACGEAGVYSIIIMSAGFGESGPEGIALEDRIIRVLGDYDDMRILGPNCLGIIAPAVNLNVSFASHMPKKGKVAFISQSGALCTSVLDWAHEENIGFSYFVSVGNSLDVSYGDLIDYFGEDEGTGSMILYIESIQHARKFMTAARAFARTKPIVAYKAGRFPESARVAASHTGAMATEDAIYDAAFKRAGIVRVFDIGEIFDTAEMIGKYKIPKGPRLGIVTNAGGPGVMAADAIFAQNGVLAELSDDTMQRLNDTLPSMWSHGNPVDVLGDARAKRIAKAARIVIDDPGVDALLVILTPQAMTNPTATANEIVALAADAKKPILANWLGGASMREGTGILNKQGIATYDTPEQAVRAFMVLVSYSRNLKTLYETPKDIPVTFSIDRLKLRSEFSSIVVGAAPVLSETISKQILASYGIPVTTPLPAATADRAAEHARTIGFPVVLKIDSPDISHKTDVRGVALDLTDETTVRAAFERIVGSARAALPGASITGTTVQRMVKESDALEMILGIKRDPIFGTVLLAGMGGITSELFRDTRLGFPPLNERLALTMLESLKIWPLLNGYRGKPRLAIEALIEAMIRLSYLAADYPEITQLDINPLLVTPHEVIALDARAAIDTDPGAGAAKPYAHLALRPYPEEYVSSRRLSDGSSVLLRPIKPEDEPMWMDMLSSCSRETIYLRFRYFFQWASHEVAARYCYIDYDREIAIVAEIETEGVRTLVGVGRLIAAPGLETAEYAILITDAWQNRELGSALTDYCLDIAAEWGIKRVIAFTTPDNHRMIAVFKKRGFTIEIDNTNAIVEVVKDMDGYRKG